MNPLVNLAVIQPKIKARTGDHKVNHKVRWCDAPDAL